MRVSPRAPRGVSAPAPPEQPGEAQRARLRRACEDFEGIVLGLMVKEMQATVPRDGALPLGAGGRIFTSLWGQALAREGAKRSPLGIAEMLMKALTTRGGDGKSAGASSSSPRRPTVEIEGARAYLTGAAHAVSPLAEERERP